MIKCLACGRMASMTYHEEIDSCPYCASDSWHIYHLQPGFYPEYNKRIMKLIQQSSIPPKGRCFITPKSRIVPLGLLRLPSEEATKLEEGEKGGDKA
jgi:hypothetical protein